MSAPPLVVTVVRAHAARVHRALRYLGVPAADLDDACQEVFLVVHRREADLDPGARVETWLYGICLRVAAARRKARARRPEAALDEGPEPALGDDAARVSARLDLLRALESLDEVQRQVFVLSDIEQWPMREIARLQRVPLFTAYSRLRLARARLRAALKEAP